MRTVGRLALAAPFWDDDGKAYLVHSVLAAGPLILHLHAPAAAAG